MGGYSATDLAATGLQAATESFYATVLEAEDLCQPMKALKLNDDQP